VHLQLQNTVTSTLKCRQHGSTCSCLVSFCRRLVSWSFCQHEQTGF
jgi:hypothetical protein